MSARPKILLLAYLVSPLRGTEYSVAWNHITWMAEHCEITVLYGSAGLHMGDMEEIEGNPIAEGLPNVRFVPVRSTGLARLLNAANRRGFLTYSFYLAYREWHREAARVASGLVQAEKFDLVHYLGPIGYREPGYLYKLDLPYVWGPIGGATHVSVHLAPALPLSGRLKLGLRAVINWFQLRFSGRVRQALHRADVLLTATTENQDIFRRVAGVDSVYLPENGVTGNPQLNRDKFKDFSRIKLIWIGKLEARKALKVLIEALALLPQPQRFEVHVVGDGPLRLQLQEQVRQVGLAGVFVWHGQVPRADVHRLLDASHMHVITSVSEANTTVLWEAMECGVPTLTVDHCGMHDIVRVQTGLKAPLGPYHDVVRAISRHLAALARDPAQLESMAENVLLDADTYHWRHRPAFWLARYREAIERFQAMRVGRPGESRDASP
jgi:glycosyltransferase involved in cell wall biosynthesis